MKLSIRDLDLPGRRVFIRVDFNVPLENGVVTDDTRIRASVPTIRYALERGATVILASHLGRPKGQVNPKYSLKPVAPKVAELLGRPVSFAPDCIGDAAKSVVDDVHRAGGGVVLLENLRFHPEEEKNDAAFARQLASLTDLYVNDAFGAAHRAHASVEAITHVVGKAAAGLLMEKELEYLGRVLTSPDRPLVAILGGAKVSDKLEVIQNFLVARRSPHHRRRHGLHVPEIARPAGRPLARRRRQDRRGARHRDKSKGPRTTAGAAGRSCRRREDRSAAHRAKRWMWTTRRSAIAWVSTSGRRRSVCMRT